LTVTLTSHVISLRQSQSNSLPALIDTNRDE
jgi:hypothetical protein